MVPISANKNGNAIHYLEDERMDLQAPLLVLSEEAFFILHPGDVVSSDRAGRT